jgi:pimeloyl-ACP methyl ester carboxylesterase
MRPESLSSGRLAEDWVDINGNTVHYVRLGHGPALVFIHGLGGSWTDWSENLSALADACTVYAIDLPGFGGSPPPVSEIEYTYEYVASFLASLADHFGLDHFSIAGTSLGGGISLRLAIDFPNRVERVIVANATGLGRQISWLIRLLSIPGVARLALSRVNREQVRGIWTGMFADPSIVDEEKVEQTWQWIQKPETRRLLPGIYRHGASVLGQKHLLLPELHRIECPVLIVWGADDPVIPAVQGTTARSRIVRSTLHVLGACGHVPQIEQAKEFNRLAVAFMSQR